MLISIWRELKYVNPNLFGKSEDNYFERRILRYRLEKIIMFRRNAFTLIELLVVIAVIALLLAIILPALKIAKQQASAIVCMSNEHQLALVWGLYYDDNEAFIVDGDTGDTTSGYFNYTPSGGTTMKPSIRRGRTAPQPPGPNGRWPV